MLRHRVNGNSFFHMSWLVFERSVICPCKHGTSLKLCSSNYQSRIIEQESLRWEDCDPHLFSEGVALSEERREDEDGVQKTKYVHMLLRSSAPKVLSIKQSEVV